MVENIIIDVVGSFADGKTTLVRALTNESTLRHSEEKKRGITIRLGYAHFLLYKCKKCASLSRKQQCERCGSTSELYRKVSIIDSPGHKTLMTIMLSGAALVSGAVLVIAANQKCPQPQTEEHLNALRIIGIKNLVVAQTKVDIVSPQRAKENYQEIKKFLSENGFDDIPIIPVFSTANVNITELIQEIGRFTMENATASKSPVMLVVRSFDANRPGTAIKDLVGGILGGALKEGELSIGDEIEIYPGIQAKNGWQPLKSRVIDMHSEFGKESKVAKGLTIGLQTSMDPALTRRDSLAGSLIVSGRNQPQLKQKISFEYLPLEKQEKNLFKKSMQRNEVVLLNILAGKALATVTAVSGNKITVSIINSVLPYFIGDNAIVSRKLDNVWTLAGSGKIYD